MFKAIGGCNEAKRDVNMCLRAQRLERTARNREDAKKKRESIEQKWKEMDLET